MSDYTKYSKVATRLNSLDLNLTYMSSQEYGISGILLSGQYTTEYSGEAVATFESNLMGDLDPTIVIRKNVMQLLTTQEKNGILAIFTRLTTLAEGVI